VADSTPGPTDYPGQQAKTLYAQKIRYRGRRRKEQPQDRKGHKRIVMWAAVLVLVFLLLRLL
jgi:hypothetical protein